MGNIREQQSNEMPEPLTNQYAVMRVDVKNQTFAFRINGSDYSY